MRTQLLPRPRDRRALGTAGLRVSPLCIGRVRDPDTVSAAFELGINFFLLSADMHWPIYDGLRRGLAALLARGHGVRDEVVVAVVSYVTQPEFCVAPFHEVLASVPGLDRIDVTVMGGAYAHDFFVRLGPYRRHAATVPGVRAVATSFHDRSAAALAVETDLVDLALARYNPAHPAAESDLFPHIARRRALVYTFKSTFGYVSPARCDELGVPAENWRPELTDAYRFALSRPEIDGLLCSPATPGEVEQLVNALASGPLDDDECDYLRQLSMLDRGETAIEPPRVAV